MEFKKGDILSETQYYKVLSKDYSGITVETDSGDPVHLSNSYADTQLQSAHEYSKEEKVTKTELAELFVANPRTAMTVTFYKQVKEVDVKNKLYELYANKGGKVISEADYKKKVNAIVKETLLGEERTMVGRHNSTKDDFGRVHFIDMEVERDRSKSYDTRQRLVDPRTIKMLIVNNTKYILK